MDDIGVQEKYDDYKDPYSKMSLTIYDAIT